MKWTDIRALVTGGTRGIGAAVAFRLSELGAKVTVTGASGSHDMPSHIGYRQVNFADRTDIEAFAESLRGEEWNVLVNNAGINAISPFAEIKSEDFDRLHEVNLRAPFLLCRAVVPYMVQRKWGRIVNVTSIFGHVSKEKRASYSSTKFGLYGLTKALAIELAADNVLANCVAPGFIDTELTRRVLGEAGMKELAAQVPARRMGTPEEIARFVSWVAGPENTFLTGQNLVIDGGFTSA